MSFVRCLTPSLLTMVRHAVNYSSDLHGKNNEELREILHNIADERGIINRRRVGRWISRNAGRIVDGKRFVRAAGKSSAEKWLVESVSSVSEGPRKKNVTDNAYSRASSGE